MHTAVTQAQYNSQLESHTLAPFNASTHKMKFLEFNFTSATCNEFTAGSGTGKGDETPAAQAHKSINYSAITLLFDLLARRRQERAMTYSCRTATS